MDPKYSHMPPYKREAEGDSTTQAGREKRRFEQRDPNPGKLAAPEAGRDRGRVFPWSSGGSTNPLTPRSRSSQIDFELLVSGSGRI